MQDLQQEVLFTKYTERYTLFGADNKPKPVTKEHMIQTQKKIPKLGIMLVGWGGNNGTTLTSGILANKLNLSFETKTGIHKPNYYGSFTQCATARVGLRQTEDGGIEDVHVPIKELVPLVNPNDVEITGWDISSLDLYHSAKRAQVLEPDLLKQLKEHLSGLKPMKAAFNSQYIASNQSDRVDNIIVGDNETCLQTIREDIRNFKSRVDKVIILWTANTEKFYEKNIETIENLEELIRQNKSIPASILYCYAAILESVVFLNGSPQNTLHPCLIKLAEEKGSFLGGSDFKTGQTRFKTIMSDFLIGAGLRLASVVSYNHLGNNDGKNLFDQDCFKSKQISKASVLDDAIKSNKILYNNENSHIDHEVVIKYVPFVGDSKRALDEYTSQIFLSGINTISTYNICEDSLLAAPIMLDIILLAEFLTRVQVDGKSLGPVLSYLSFFFKAPVTNHKQFVVNSFSRQRELLTNFLKACAGYEIDDGTLMGLNY